MEYMALKHTHVLIAVISVLLFYIRSIARIKQLKWANNKSLTISNHIANTFLLVSAIALSVYLGMSPHNQPWLMEKIILVIVYIVIGVFIARQHTVKGQLVLLLLATLTIMSIFHVALYKTSLFF
jgi:uncharacterized membrane protein SirB2